MNGSARPSDRDAHVAASSCDGSRDCEAETHLHGCFADRGNCDDPEQHNRRWKPKETESRV